MRSLDGDWRAGLDDADAALVDGYQSGFPVVERPFRVVGEDLGVSEDEALTRVERLRDRGIFRRFGAVLTPPVIGSSTLAAVQAPPERFDEALNEPDPAKHVFVENAWDRIVTVDVRVVRNATGETVLNGSYELAPGERTLVYNTSTANPEGVERFTIFSHARNTTDAFSIETSECYGSAYVVMTGVGSIEGVHSIC